MKTELVLILLLEVLGVVKCRVLDMTYPFSATTTYWPGAQNFKLETFQNGTYDTPNGKKIWVQMGSYSAATHGGTHMDAPTHILTTAPHDQWSVDKIPPHRLMGPLRVLDITQQSSTDREYQLSVSDIFSHERRFGKIPNGAIILAYSGWGAKYENKTDYLGKNYAEGKLDFPGFSEDAAKWLVQHRDIYGAGIDTPSLDIGSSPDYPVHRAFFENNIYGLENVANVDQAPETGAVIMALPLKTDHGSGAPTRILAVWGDERLTISGGESSTVCGVLVGCLLMTIRLWI